MYHGSLKMTGLDDKNEEQCSAEAKTLEEA